MKEIRLKSIPGNWAECSLEELQKLDDIKGKFPSEAVYQTYCFLELTNLVPLVYAERWRAILGSIPFIRQFVKKTGRKLDKIEEDYLGMAAPFITYKSCYRLRGWRHKLFGRRFWIKDRQIAAWLKELTWLNGKPFFLTNPVTKKSIAGKIYTSSFTRLADMSWADYSRCSMYWELYHKTKQSGYLEKFIAILYKVEDPKIIRGKFSPLETMLIQIFWNSVQHNYMKTFPHLFKSGGKESKKGHTDYMKNEAQITVFLAKQANALPREVQDMEAFYALEYMERNAEEVEAHEKEIIRIKHKR